MANWRYYIGKTASDFTHSILSSPLMPLTRAIPVGISYPYDIKRFNDGDQIKTILDVGANIGQTSLFLTRYFPKADIFAFEPVQATFETLRKNSKPFNNINPVNYALGSSKGEKTITIRSNSELNTLVESTTSSLLLEDRSSETLKITTVDNFCNQQGIRNIDILKMDVQGYELEVLRGAKHFLENGLVNFIYSEVDFQESNRECQDFCSLNSFLQEQKFQFSGFYEFFRWGNNKKFFGFCNALFVYRG